MELISLCRVLPKSGKLHQNQEVWSGGGISPTLKATNYKDAYKVVVKCKKTKSKS